MPRTTACPWLRLPRCIKPGPEVTRLGRDLARTQPQGHQLEFSRRTRRGGGGGGDCTYVGTIVLIHQRFHSFARSL